MPMLANAEQNKRLDIIIAYYYSAKIKMTLKGFASPEHKTATYAQCSRLFGWLFTEDANEMIVTGDIDMLVFNNKLWKWDTPREGVTILGVDLTEKDQKPMCYCLADAFMWSMMHYGIFDTAESLQGCLDNLLGPIESDHFRGNHWCLDQFTLNRMVSKLDWEDITLIDRRISDAHRFARNRYDRDGWAQWPVDDIIDAHLPRPGFETQNWAKIYDLIRNKYPDDDVKWMDDYRNEYVKLLLDEV
jgi:hypothetical protein